MHRRLGVCVVGQRRVRWRDVRVWCRHVSRSVQGQHPDKGSERSGGRGGHLGPHEPGQLVGDRGRDHRRLALPPDQGGEAAVHPAAAQPTSELSSGAGVLLAAGGVIPMAGRCW